MCRTFLCRPISLPDIQIWRRTYVPTSALSHLLFHQVFPYRVPRLLSPSALKPWNLTHYGLSLGSSPGRQCSILQIPYIHHPTSILQRVTERSRRWYVRIQRYPSWVEIGTTNRSSLTHPWILSVIPEMQRLLTFPVSNPGIISILISPDHCLFLIHLSLTTPEIHVLQDLWISIAGICSAVGISYKYPPRSSLVVLAQ